jgi:protein-tyrosine phosphatase
VRTELHFHLLPGVDDGPVDEREALELAQLAVEDGTGRVVCTSHVREFDLRELPGRIAQLRASIERAGIPLGVFPGGEISPRDVAAIGDDELEFVAQGPADARWVLLEVPLWHGDSTFAAATSDLRRRGYGLLIGHPERGSSIAFDVLRDEVRRGAILQINGSSLAGLHGAEVRRRAIAIAGSGLPFIVASDAHSRERPPLMSEARRRLAEAGFSPEVVDAAIDIAPSRLFEIGLPAGASRPGEQLGLRSSKRAA